MSFITFTFISDTTYQRDHNHAVSTDISVLLTRRSSGSLTGCIKPSFIQTEKRKTFKPPEFTVTRSINFLICSCIEKKVKKQTNTKNTSNYFNSIKIPETERSVPASANCPPAWLPVRRLSSSSAYWKGLWHSVSWQLRFRFFSFRNVSTSNLWHRGVKTLI